MPDFRKDFPIFQRSFKGEPIHYLDSAATTQKPASVIEAVANYYCVSNSNIHRGIYRLAEEATEWFEESRKEFASFINAKADEVVFTKNATESLNLASHIIASAGDTGKQHNIVTTILEHHSSFLSARKLAQSTGAELRTADIDEAGNLVELPTDRNTRAVFITGMSNVLGVIPDIREIAKVAHDNNAIVVLDAAQFAGHRAVDVQKLGVDMLAASSHKMLGPTGVGMLWAKEDLLKKSEPLLLGGGMIREVSLDSASWAEPPYKFEAGTPNIAGVAGLGEAIRYLKRVTMETVAGVEKKLARYAVDKLLSVDGLNLLGPRESEGIISFTLDFAHPHDIASILDKRHVYVRAGHHCAMPLMKRLGVPATARASFHIYNNRDDIDALVEGINDVKKVFG
ncbi:SufS family cysteine desulfurase [Candidatus Woesearchaeota archaeon]|nr:MAG: SufS family cysteine desulfurase [Candidatus Woesearchaeota archaeon]